jgi:vanillate O-demethylase ferredoxin subunit
LAPDARMEKGDRSEMERVKPMKQILRKYLLPVHRWTGLTVGLVIVLMAVTGAATMFRPWLEPRLNPELLTVPACTQQASLDTMTANAQASHVNARPDTIRLLAAAPDAARMPAASVRFVDQTYVYVNPCSGVVLGQRHRFGGVPGTIEQIHRFRFMQNGSLITGTSALLFGLVLIVGGLLLWLPATVRGLKGALRYDFKLQGLARTVNLHKTTGALVSLIVLTSVLTGLPQAFDWYRDGLYRLTGSQAPAAIPLVNTAGQGARLSMQALWQRAQMVAPHPQEAVLHYEAKPGRALDMYLIEANAPHPNARSMLYLDPQSGAVVSYQPYAASSIGNQLYYWTLSLHTGEIGGLFGQILLLVGALSVPYLAYTGIASFLRRRARRPGAAVKQVARHAAPG